MDLFPFLRDQRTGGRGGDNRGLIVRIAEGSVAHFAVVDLRETDAAFRNAPGRVGQNMLRSSVLVGDVQLRDQACRRAPERIPHVGIGKAGHRAAVPALPHEHGQGVVTFQQGGDVILLILQPFPVRGPAGGEEKAADPAAVQAGFIHAGAGDGKHGGCDLFFQMKAPGKEGNNMPHV